MGPSNSGCGCRVHFRLAHFADRQHGAAVKHLASLDHGNRCALLGQKRQRAAELRAAWQEEQRRGAVKPLKDRHGGRLYADPAHDQMQAALAHNSKSVPALEQEIAEAEARPGDYLKVCPAARAVSADP